MNRCAWWGVTQNSKIMHRPATGLTPDTARDVRARAWRFILDCYDAKKKGGPETAPDGTKESENIGTARDKCSK